MMVYGAIDIGSNAARLLISEVFEYEGKLHFKKRSLVRVPLRLGEEVFGSGTIPEQKATDIMSAMKAYKYLLDVHHVSGYKAVATSAMRDASNGMQIVQQVKRETGIEIEIISGKSEAELLYITHFEETLNPEKSYLYVDVGGGSTEVSLFSKGRIANTRSFNIGTIRLMKDQVSHGHWQELKSWVEIHLESSKDVLAIGSGGNINKLYKLNGSRSDKKISTQELLALYDKLESYSYMERMTELGMRGDRADVIMPATKIFIKVLQWARIKEIYVPKFGVSDGIVRMLAKKLELTT